MKINVHKAASYSRLLEKCTNAVWENPDADQQYTFTLMDTQGMVINDKLIVDQPDGSDRELPWSLETYVQITKKTYVTQPKFIVFRAPAIGMCLESMYCHSHNSIYLTLECDDGSSNVLSSSASEAEWDSTPQDRMIPQTHNQEIDIKREFMYVILHFLHNLSCFTRHKV